MQIIIYGRKEPACPYCEAAVKFAEENSMDITYIDINDLTDAERQNIKEFYGRKTVPIIILEGEYIGGYNEFRDSFGT